MNKKTILISSLAIILIGMGAAWFIKANFANLPMDDASLATDNSQAVALTEKTSDLGFEKSGKVIFVAKKVGDHVAMGEVLAKIESADLAAQYAQSRSGIAVAMADLAALQNSLKKEKLKLKADGLSSNDKKIQKAQIASVENNINAQWARVAQSQDNAKNFSAQLDKMVLSAPFAGTITREDLALGEIVNPNVSVITLSISNNLNQ